MTTSLATDTESTVRRYFALVADLSSTEDDLRAVVSPDVRVTEHPNPVTPGGAVRDAEQNLAGFLAGKALLAEQRIEVRDVLVCGDLAAVRALWTGVVGVDAGPFAAGQRLECQMGAFVRVRDGLVVEHETFDCYAPF
jgi:ketosteroid isomerase-like protein